MDSNIFISGSNVWITYKFLFEKGVPEEVVYYNTSNKKNKKPWYTRTHPSNNRLRLISYNTIPEEFIVRYKLSHIYELLEIENIQRQKRKGKDNVKHSKILKTSLDLAYSQWESITRDLAKAS